MAAIDKLREEAQRRLLEEQQEARDLRNASK